MSQRPQAWPLSPAWQRQLKRLGFQRQTEGVWQHVRAPHWEFLIVPHHPRRGVCQCWRIRLRADLRRYRRHEPPAIWRRVYRMTSAGLQWSTDRWTLIPRRIA